MDQPDLQVVQQTPIDGVNTKIQFGALNAPTPEWANWMFRIVFLVTTVLSGYIAATSYLSVNAKYEITIVLKLLIDPFIWGLSKMFGVVVEDKSLEDRIKENSGIILRK